MKEVALLLQELLEAGLIRDYAIFGAVAQMRYTEAVATLDVDVLVDLPEGHPLAPLSEVYAACARRGYRPEGEAIRVGAWPVQLIPVFDTITREALEVAETADFEGIPLRVVSPRHLAVIALSVGRAKDYARILALLDAGSVTQSEIAELAGLHALGPAWERFRKRFVDE